MGGGAQSKATLERLILRLLYVFKRMCYVFDSSIKLTCLI